MMLSTLKWNGMPILLHMLLKLHHMDVVVLVVVHYLFLSLWLLVLSLLLLLIVSLISAKFGNLHF